MNTIADLKKKDFYDLSKVEKNELLIHWINSNELSDDNLAYEICNHFDDKIDTDISEYHRTIEILKPYPEHLAKGLYFFAKYAHNKLKNNSDIFWALITPELFNELSSELVKHAPIEFWVETFREYLIPKDKKYDKYINLLVHFNEEWQDGALKEAISFNSTKKSADIHKFWVNLLKELSNKNELPPPHILEYISPLYWKVLLKTTGLMDSQNMTSEWRVSFWETIEKKLRNTNEREYNVIYDVLKYIAISNLMLAPDDWQKIDVTYSMSIITREISKYDNSFVKYWISAYIPDGTIVSDTIDMMNLWADNISIGNIVATHASAHASRCGIKNTELTTNPEIFNLDTMAKIEFS